MNDTIFALSSGVPPAAIAVLRISGPQAGHALDALAGVRPKPRKASVRLLRGSGGELLDNALVIWFPGPGTATGEDLAELHLHGGRAVIAAVEKSLADLPGMRRAEPGEFTRRAFANGRIDLAEAEGLADLLQAETELQRRQALAMASGSLSSKVSGWREAVLLASAQIEALLDFGDEDDVQDLPAAFSERIGSLAGEIGASLESPSAERLREGFRVVLAGPPNAGKSSLFNKLVNEDAAIIAPIPGTTRDVLTRPVAMAGIPFLFADTAGLREDTSDTVEVIGIQRAKGELTLADIVLWLGPEGESDSEQVWEIESFADTFAPRKASARHRVSSVSGEGIDGLRNDLIETARGSMIKPGTVALNQRQRQLLLIARQALDRAQGVTDLLLIAEEMRTARGAFDRLLGNAATEDMLDTLFGRFCIGK
ncbi:tRNA uridine-5-carboxymethylaminomethyl(34) synthesis GTPase MnmE [Novosphingobium sp. M1R2S20]|uniref:tRNA modification GTPase MnmE n=1 Tax=Novosphingobium rhizovicinum TaxID=3228928 RepID=A0ABV3R9G8_9SPHN